MLVGGLGNDPVRDSCRWEVDVAVTTKSHSVQVGMRLVSIEEG